MVNNSLFCNKDIISRIQVDPKLQKPSPFTTKYRFFNFSSSRNSVIINGTATCNRSETYLGLSFLFLKSVVESLPLCLSCCRSLKLLPFISPPSLSYRSRSSDSRDQAPFFYLLGLQKIDYLHKISEIFMGISAMTRLLLSSMFLRVITSPPTTTLIIIPSAAKQVAMRLKYVSFDGNS